MQPKKKKEQKKQKKIKVQYFGISCKVMLINIIVFLI